MRPFLQNAQQAAELDREIRFTDGTDSLTGSRIGLIDGIVYRLYGRADLVPIPGWPGTLPSRSVWDEGRNEGTHHSHIHGCTRAEHERGVS